MLVMFYMSKQALCFHLGFTSHSTSPIILAHNSSLGHQKLYRPSDRCQNPAFQVVQEYFLFVSLIRNITVPLTHSVATQLPWSLQLSVPDTQTSCLSAAAGSSDTAAEAQRCLMHHLEAQAVLQMLWKPSEVKGEASWQSWCDSWSLQSALSTPASSWAADTAAWEPLARSLTFPDEAVCPCSWIRALEALHHQIQEVFKTLINKHFSLLKVWIRSQDILSFEITTQSFKRRNHSSWNPMSLCRNFSLIKTQ